MQSRQGVARQRQAIVNGLRDSILNFSSDVSDVSSKEVIEMMMVTQYFDMLRDIGGNNRRAAGLPHCIRMPDKHTAYGCRLQ